MKATRHELNAAAYSLAGAGASFAFGVLLARALGPVDRGEFLAIQLPVVLLLPLAVVGTGQAAVYYIASSPARSAEYSQAALVIAGFASVTVASVGSVVVLTLGRPLWALLFWYLPPFAVLGLLANLFRGHERFVAWSRTRLLAIVAPVIGVPAFWLAGLRGLNLAVATMVVPTALAFFVALIAAKPLLRANQVRPTRSAVRDLLRFGAPGMAGIVINGLGRRVDQLLLAIVLAGSAELGNYAVAASYSAMVFTLAVAIGQPSAVAVASSDLAERQAKAVTVIKTWSVPLCGAGAACALAGFVVVQPLFGDRYAQAVLPAAILSIGAGFFAVASVGAEMLRAMGRPRDVIVVEVAGLAVQLVTFIVLVPRLSIVGAAVASLTGYLAAAAAALLLVIRPPRYPTPTLVAAGSHRS